MNKVDWIKVINIVQSYLFPIRQIDTYIVEVMDGLIPEIWNLNRVFLLQKKTTTRKVDRYILPLIIRALTMTTASSLYVYTCALTLNFRSAIHWYLEAKSQCIINENIASFFFSLSLFLVATAYVYDDKVASFLKMLNILLIPFSVHARPLSSSSSLRHTKG
jgi:hypothetical protein